MRELFREVKLNSYFSAIAGLLIGLILLFWPGASLTLVCAVIGVAVLAVAVVQIVLFLEREWQDLQPAIIYCWGFCCW